MTEKTRLCIIRITSDYATEHQVTPGVLLLNDLPFCCTLELPWRDNDKNVSCIPPGVYNVKRVTSPKYGKTIAVKDVPGRSGILFHVGNTVEDSRGCILVGSTFGHRRDVPFLYNSRVTMDKLREHVLPFHSLAVGEW